MKILLEGRSEDVHVRDATSASDTARDHTACTGLKDRLIFRLSFGCGAAGWYRGWASGGGRCKVSGVRSLLRLASRPTVHGIVARLVTRIARRGPCAIHHIIIMWEANHRALMNDSSSHHGCLGGWKTEGEVVTVSGH